MSTIEPKNPPTINIWDIFVILGRRKFTLFGIPLLVAIIVGIFCITTSPIFTAVARVLPPQYNQYNVNGMNQQLGGESSLGNASLGIKNPSDLYIGILRSTTILDALISRFNLSQYYGLEIKDDARTKLLKATDVTVGKDGILSIIVEDKSPQFAADLANAYVDELYNFSRDLAQKEATRRTLFYESVLGKAKDKLKAADLALLDVQKRTGFTNLSGQDEAIVDQASSLQDKIAARRTELQALLTFATEKHPDVIMLRSEISNMELQVAQLTQGRSLKNTKTVGGRKDGAAIYAEKPKASDIPFDNQNNPKKPNNVKSPFVPLGDAPAAMLEHTEKTREVEYWKNMVEMLGKFNEMGKIDETRDLSLIQLLDRAIPAHYKSKPKTTLNVFLAFLVTWVLCFIFIIFTEWLKSTSVFNTTLANKLQEVKKAWAIKRT